MSATTEEQIRALGQRWAEAEVRADVAELEAMSTEDFTLVGPLGFVLTKQQWLAGYRQGDLVTTSLDWDEVEVREYDGAAVAIGRRQQAARFRGQAADGSFRVTQIAVRRERGWQLAGVHLSPLGAPPPFMAQGNPADQPVR